MWPLLLLALAHAVHGEPADDDVLRRLEALPVVADVDFQDLDLAEGSIGGRVTWSPPSDDSLIVGYEVYLTDSVGQQAVQWHLGSVLVTEQSLAVPVGTNLTTAEGRRSHIFVFSRSSLGTSPQGFGVEVCDVGGQDSVFLVNGQDVPQDWGVLELSFFASADCAGAPLRWASAGATATLLGYNASRALDGDAATAWASDCGSGGCREGALSLGALGVCRPESVRCVYLKQCYPGVGDCPAAAGRLEELRLIARGKELHRWRVLKAPASGNIHLQEELLVVARPGGAYRHFSEGPRGPAHLTHTFGAR